MTGSAPSRRQASQLGEICRPVAASRFAGDPRAASTAAASETSACTTRTSVPPDTIRAIACRARTSARLGDQGDWRQPRAAIQRATSRPNAAKPPLLHSWRHRGNRTRTVEGEPAASGPAEQATARVKGSDCPETGARWAPWPGERSARCCCVRRRRHPGRHRRPPHQGTLVRQHARTPLSRFASRPHLRFGYDQNLTEVLRCADITKRGRCV